MSVDARLEDEIGRLGALARMVDGTASKGPFENIAKLARDALGAPLAAVTLIDSDSQRICASDGLPIAGARRESAFCDSTIRGRDVFIVRNAAVDPRFHDNPYVVGPPGVRAYIGAPLTTPDGYNLGALCVIDTRPRNFGAAEAGLLRHLAALVVKEMIANGASRDPLTGVLSRGAWREGALAMMAEIRAEGRAAALVLAEAGGIAEVNLRAGAPAGDELLATLAGALAEAAGPAAVIGRVAGDQFAAVIPGVDAEAALAAMERARDLFAAAPRQLLLPGDGDVHLGAASLVASIDTPETWISVAELSLAFAKDFAAPRLLAG